MFWQLFCKELKFHFKSITYYIFVVIVALFYFSQVTLPKGIDEIKPMSKEEIEKIVSKLPEEQRVLAKARLENSSPKRPMTDIKMKQKAMCGHMDMEIRDKIASTYKVGFLKKVKLSDAQINIMKEAMDKISPKKEISEEEFVKVLNEVDKALGGGSYYGDKMRESILRRKATDEEALQQYNAILKEDKLTNAEAREFADYMGITAGLFPIFITAFILIRDMKSGAQEIIFSKKVSSFKYILAKYLAALVALIVPYLIVATHLTLIYSKIAVGNNITIDYFAFYKYILMWIVPTLMFVTALGMIFAVFFRKPIVAIIVQFMLWAISITDLIGGYSLYTILIRYNAVTSNTEYMKWADSININRMFYLILSIAMMSLTAFIYNRRRGALGEKLSLL